MAFYRTEKSPFLRHAVPVLILVVSVLIAAFYTYDSYYLLTAQKDELRQAQSDKAELGKTLAGLSDLKTRASVPAFAADISRYAAPYREDAIITSLFQKVPGIMVVSAGMRLGEKLPSGLSLADIAVTVRADTENAIIKYLEALTGKDGKKRFAIKQVSFPFSTVQTPDGPFQATVSLGMYYLSK